MVLVLDVDHAVLLSEALGRLDVPVALIALARQETRPGVDLEPDLPHTQELRVGAAEASILQLVQDVLLQRREGLSEPIGVAGAQGVLPRGHVDGVEVERVVALVLEAHGPLRDRIGVPRNLLCPGGPQVPAQLRQGVVQRHGRPRVRHHELDAVAPAPDGASVDGGHVEIGRVVGWFLTREPKKFRRARGVVWSHYF